RTFRAAVKDTEEWDQEESFCAGSFRNVSGASTPATRHWSRRPRGMSRTGVRKGMAWVPPTHSEHLLERQLDAPIQRPAREGDDRLNAHAPADREEEPVRGRDGGGDVPVVLVVDGDGRVSCR